MTMDCSAFEDLLFARLEGPLDVADESALREHALECLSCRRLQAVLRDEEDAAGIVVEVPGEFLRGVVARTSGSACERVVMLLAESLDAALDGRGTLLSAHLDVCPDCAACARALARLRVDLPGLAAPDPGESFTTAVLAATTGAPRRTAPALDAARRGTGTGGWVGRAQEAVERLLQRPRVALEGAYAVALVLFLTIGLPSASLVDLPVRAFTGLRQEAVRVEKAVVEGVDTAVVFGRRTWTDSTARAARYLTFESEDGALRAAFERDLEMWASGVYEVFAGIRDALIGPLAGQLRALWPDEIPDETDGQTTQDRNPQT